MTTKTILVIAWAIMTVQLVLLAIIKEQNIKDLIKLKDAYAREAAISTQYYSSFCIEDKNGVLIFKWNEREKKLSEVLKLFPETPLFGHTTGSRSQTKWLCFMKL